MSKTLIILPTYNERENLGSLLGRIALAVPGAHVLVVDDGSPDGTGELADSIAAGDPRVSVLHRAGKSGLGAAYRAAYALALSRGYDRIVQMDADGSHRPEDLPRLLLAAESNDVVVGSRWVRGGGVVNWPLRRILLSVGGSAYARIALGLPFRDITGGFRVFSAFALESIRATQMTSQGYCFQIEMLWRSHLEGLRIVELPITFVEREFGESKMSGNIVTEAISAVTGWGLRSLPHRLTGGRIAVRPVASDTAGVRS